MLYKLNSPSNISKHEVENNLDLFMRNKSGIFEREKNWDDLALGSI
jgi:hypothetical protein